MSEPRKLNTGEARRVYHAGDAPAAPRPSVPRTPAAPTAPTAPSAPRTPTGSGRSVHVGQAAHSAGILEEDAYAAARRRAQEAAEETIRLRRSQQIPRAQVEQGLTPAQRQAIALRRAGQQAAQPRQPAARPVNVSRAPQGAAAGRTVRRPEAAAPAPAARRQAYDFDREEAAQRAPTPVEEAAALLYQDRAPAPKAAGHGGSGDPPHRSGGAQSAHGASRRGGRSGGPQNPKNKGQKKKKGPRWWQVLLITLLVIALIFLGTLRLIQFLLAPEAGTISINSLINTPQELKDDEFNFLMIGIDRSTENEDAPDEQVNDGNTDMILWVHFNNKTGELKMLQIPRDYLYTTDRSLSGNFRINNIAKTQALTANSMNMGALCNAIAEMFQIPIDGYISIRVENLVEMVDLFGGIEMNLPFDIDDGLSHRSAGYQTLDGAAVEFVLRARTGVYSNGDIGRLNFQRQFYSALFRRVKEMTMFDLARHVPAFLNWMETNISVTKLASFAVSVLRVDNDKIMICQMPARSGRQYVPPDGGAKQAVLYPARQEAADLLNTYFRENTGPVDASQLQLCDQNLSDAAGPIDVSAMEATDPNIQFMGDIMRADAAAQQDNNLDNSHTVTYDAAETTEAEGDPAA